MNLNENTHESVLECNFDSEHDNVELFISEIQTFLKVLNLQNCEMETEVKCKISNTCEQLPRPSELQLSSVERSSRFSSGTVYSPVTELSMNLGDLSTDTG